MTEGGLEPAAAACVFPGFEGLEVPDWPRRELANGLGGVVLFAHGSGSSRHSPRNRFVADALCSGVPSAGPKRQKGGT